jgi:hypothetical protein
MADYLNEIQKAALLSVLDPDYQAYMRKLCRWYSVKFHTPLHEVENLPKDYIYQHYFEAYYEDMEPEEQHNQIIFLLETPEEREKRLKEEDDSLSDLEQEVKEGLSLQDILAKNKALKAANSKEKKAPLIPPPNKPLKSQPEALPKDLPEEVKVEFVDDFPD